MAAHTTHWIAKNTANKGTAEAFGLRFRAGHWMQDYHLTKDQADVLDKTGQFELREVKVAIVKQDPDEGADVLGFVTDLMTEDPGMLDTLIKSLKCTTEAPTEKHRVRAIRVWAQNHPQGQRAGASEIRALIASIRGTIAARTARERAADAALPPAPSLAVVASNSTTDSAAPMVVTPAKKEFKKKDDKKKRKW